MGGSTESINQLGTAQACESLTILLNSSLFKS